MVLGVTTRLQRRAGADSDCATCRRLRGAAIAALAVAVMLAFGHA